MFVVTGSATASGHPLYRTAHGWSRRFHEAAVLDAARRDAALRIAHADQFTICDPYAIEITVDDTGPSPKSLRERIRASGPTVPIP
jgi:hypothetical protein